MSRDELAQYAARHGSFAALSRATKISRASLTNWARGKGVVSATMAARIRGTLASSPPSFPKAAAVGTNAAFVPVAPASLGGEAQAR
jgi:hypothetical protein